MKLSLVEEIRHIDKKASLEYGLPEIALMENAGHRVAEALSDMIGGVRGKSICVFAGTGNNGGDAMVAARHLVGSGGEVKLFLIGEEDHLTKPAAVNLRILQQMNLEVCTLNTERAWDRLQLTLKFTDAVVDGILGTGATGELRQNVARLVALINQAALPVVAVDVPTGVDADTGRVASEAIRATVTIALGLPKCGHFVCPGATHTGMLIVDDIGLPNTLIDDEHIKQTLIDDQLATTLLPIRPLDAHKGTCGRILVIAGSRGLTGAATMAAMSALRSGAGLVTLAAPASLNDIMETKLTEVMNWPLQEESNRPGIISGEQALAELLALAEESDAVLIGPGLGRDDATGTLVRKFAASIDKPLVMDADALYFYHDHTKELAQMKQIPVLTPHLGEMAGLLGIEADKLRGSLLSLSRQAAAEYQAVFVVKSECTIVVYPNGEAFFTAKGNPAMATAGSGDVLAGTIAGLMKQTETGLAPLAGVYLHGTAGDLAAEDFSDGLVASDIMDKLPVAIKALRKLQQGVS